MTLEESVDTLRSRFDRDQDPDDPRLLDDNEFAASKIVTAARTVSRDAYFLWSSQNPLTLTVATEFDLLNSSTSQKPCFHCYGVYINARWLDEMSQPRFMANFSDYVTASTSSNPWAWCPILPSKVRVGPGPNSTAVASTCYTRGFLLHDAYTWNQSSVGGATVSKDTELQGPEEMHDLIVDRAYLDNSKSHVQGDAYARRQLIAAEYLARTGDYRTFNIANYKQQTVGSGMGLTRRVLGLGNCR